MAWKAGYKKGTVHVEVAPVLRDSHSGTLPSMTSVFVFLSVVVLSVAENGADAFEVCLSATFWGCDCPRHLEH